MLDAIKCFYGNFVLQQDGALADIAFNAVQNSQLSCSWTIAP